MHLTAFKCYLRAVLLGLLLLLSPANAQQTQQPIRDSPPVPETSRRVAIIGAGSAGSSAAYYLSKYADDLLIPVNITVFERSSYVGGRSTTVNAFDDPSEPVELGASIFVEANKNLFSAAKEFGLPLSSAGNAGTNEAEETLGVWDGKEFVFKQSSGGWYWWDIAKLVWRYGLAPMWTQNLMKATVDKFLKMYEAPLFPWRSLSEVVQDTGLTEVTAITGSEILEKNSISQRFSREIIQASTRVNYGQNLGLIHGLETMVCMATDGAMSIEGGNWQIFDRMLKASKANVQLDTKVTQIQRKADGTYNISSASTPSNSNKSSTASTDSFIFDTVILAAPLQFSDINICPDLPKAPDEIPYVKLYVTLFTSPYHLSPSFFNIPPDSPVPEMVITTLPEGVDLGSKPKGAVGPAGFWSISTLRSIHPPRSHLSENITEDQSRAPHYLYKLFSPTRPTASFFSQLLNFTHVPVHDSDTDGIDDIDKPHISWHYSKTWHSYPYLYPRVTFEELRIDVDREKRKQRGRHTTEGGGGGLSYTSGIEAFISTMETSSLMGNNIARLIAEEWELEEMDGRGQCWCGSGTTFDCI